MLTEKAEKLAKGTKDVMDMYIQYALDSSGIASMDSDDFENMKLFVTMVYDLCEYITQEAKVLDQINNKLDTISHLRN